MAPEFQSESQMSTGKKKKRKKKAKAQVVPKARDNLMMGVIGREGNFSSKTELGRNFGSQGLETGSLRVFDTKKGNMNGFIMQQDRKLIPGNFLC